MSIQVGDKMPDFSLKNQEGELISSETFLDGSPSIIYFYPKNFTPGCTAEACGFRDNYSAFNSLGATIVGVSGDSDASHQKFAKRYELPYTLLSDAKGNVRKLFGVKTNLLGLIPGRETFIFDDKGILVYRFDAINASKHIKKSLTYLKKMSAL